MTETRIEASSPQAGGLKRTFGMREAVTITAGSVIGVGLFTTGSNVVGTLGPAVILATQPELQEHFYRYYPRSNCIGFHRHRDGVIWVRCLGAGGAVVAAERVYLRSYVDEGQLEAGVRLRGWRGQELI